MKNVPGERFAILLRASSILEQPHTVRRRPYWTSSIALKPMFWPVQKGGFTALPVWDWDANKPALQRMANTQL